jgi:conjugal transfer pilus assembly protein TraK
MRAKKLLISLVLASVTWTSIGLANEVPPELPFEALDGTSITPYQDEVPGDSWVRGNNQVPNTNQEPDQHQLTEPLEQVAPSESVQAAKPKKRPKILDKPVETTKIPAKNQAIDNSLQEGITIKPKPGRTASVVIAKGKLNRIVTPYADPQVLTVDNIETKIDGSVVYIATDSETAVSLFVSDTETGSATSLQLLPRDMATPVEIRIEQDATKATGTEAGSSRADTFIRQDSPYVTEIKTIMQSMGKQQIPQGFTLEEVTDEIRSASICHGISLSFVPGQLLSGHDARIVVMIAQNTGLTASVFEEAHCAGEDVMAVAAWPKVRLSPGEKTEVYILMRLPEGKNGEKARPAVLLTGG